MREIEGVPVINTLVVAKTPRFWANRFYKKNPIIGMEILAPLALLWASPQLLKNKRVNLHIDNDAASNALIRGGDATRL